MLRAWRLHLSFEVLVVHENHSSPLEVDRIRHLQKEDSNNESQTSYVSAAHGNMGVGEWRHLHGYVDQNRVRVAEA